MTEVLEQELESKIQIEDMKGFGDEMKHKKCFMALKFVEEKKLEPLS